MAITTNVKNYPKSHNNGNGGGTTVIMGGGGNGNIPADLNVTTITAAKGDIGILNGVTLSYDDGQFLYLGAGQGQILKLNGNELNYETGIINDLTSDKIKAGKIEADEISATKAWLETLNSKYITTEYLTVTKQAHFFELIIDKVRSVGGTLMMTQAQCVVDYAKAVDSNGNYLANLDDANAASYDVFWLAQESNGRKVTNDWVVNDQAYCQSFNNVSAGVNYDVSNKYYWRLVTGILNDRYMNLNTGAELPLSQAAQASVNAVTIDTPRISYTVESVDHVINTDWNAVAQTISGVITGANWNQTSGGAGNVTQGTMTTTNTVFGIQMTPIVDSDLSKSIPEKFILDCSRSRLNIGIYYTNGGSQWFPAPETPTTHYEYNLTTDYTIEAVVITNADEVEWKLVHGIRLSNTDCDNMLSGYASIPSVGDNIAQLGYRWQGANDPNEKSRGNAIIIAAYKTPDNGTGIQDDFAQYPIKPPSYAQYVAIASNASHRFELAFYRKTYMDANGSKFIGDLYAENGTSIEDLIDDATQVRYYLHIAYANSADGQTDFAKIPAVGVSYSYMGFCSDTNASDATLTYSDYEWSLVPGGTGTNGGHWECAYKNTQDPSTAPNVLPQGTTINQLPYDGWYATPQTLQDGYYTWMSQCFVSGATGQYGTWRTPIRLTGEDGQPGTDGNSIEFIYTRNNTGVAPAAPNSVDTDDYVPTGWTDNPQGVSENMMWEYVCQRYKTNGHWGSFLPDPAAVWSKWGEKGQDGDGYEYIYKHFPTEQTFGNDDSNPAHWGANQNDDYLGPTGHEWSDDPVGVDTTDKYEYVAVRKKNNGTWGTFSAPTLWSRYAAQGADGGRYVSMYGIGTSSTQAPYSIPYIAASISTMESMGWSITMPAQEDNKFIWKTEAFFAADASTAVWSNPIRLTGDNGKAGEDGNSQEFIYKHFTDIVDWSQVSTNANPANWPTNQTPDYLGPSGYQWSDNPTGVDSTNKYEYVSVREYKVHSGTTKTWGAFTTPKLWSNWGEKGQDGDGWEYIFKHFTTEQTFENDDNNPAHWTANQTDDYVGPSGYQWSDDPVGVTSEYKFEYVAVRKKENGTWRQFSTPTLWSRYSAQGADGGRYIFMYQNYVPSNPPSIVPNGSMSYTVAQLTNAGWTYTATTPDFVNGEYTYMTQAFFADQQTTSVWTVPTRITGDNGQPGEDGKYTEFIYKRFTTEQTFGNDYNNPAYWEANQNEDYLGPSGYQWSDNPTGITSTYKYEYMAEREYDGNNFGKFTTPVIWSRWGEKGQDGDGYEYIFCRVTDESSTNKPKILVTAQDLSPYTIASNTVERNSGGGVSRWRESTSTSTWHDVTKSEYLPISHFERIGSYDYPRTNWTDDPTGVDSTHTCEYVSQRKYVNSIWRNFDGPTIWSMYGGTGPQGPQGPTGPQGPEGTDGTNYKLVDQGSAAYVEMKLDSNNNIMQTMRFELNFKVMKIEGSSMRYMSMGEMRDWPKQFDGSYNQAGFYAYTRYTRNTTETPTYRYYKMSLNTSAADTDDAIFTLSYTANVAAENKDTNYITVSNKEITVALIEANIRNVSVPSNCYIADDNTTVLGYTRDTFNIQVSLASKAVWNVLDDSIATLVAADNANATEISTVKQTANQISSRVQTIEGDYVTSSQLSQTSTQIMSEVNEMFADLDVKKQVMLDLRNLDTTKFYPVAISLNNDIKAKQEYQRIKVSRGLDAGTYGNGPSQYGNHANSNNGFVVELDWNTIPSGWGTNWECDRYPNTDWSAAYTVGLSHTDENKFVARYIIKYYTAWTKTQTVGNNTIPLDHIAGHLEQNFMGSTTNGVNDEIVYLRGGSKYLVQTDWKDSNITLYSNGYSWTDRNNSQYTCSRPVLSYTDFWINPTDEQTRSQIIQTANQIQLNVYDTLYDRTGIDVEAGTITLDANNTIINGSLKIYNADEGLVIFNDSAQKAVEIIKDSIGTFGTNQNTINHLSGSTKTCTYIIGNNGGYRMYINRFDTSAETNDGGYATETKYYGDVQHLPAILRLGRHSNGETLIFQNVQWTMEGSYSGVRTDYKVKARLYWLNSDHTITSWGGWMTPNYSNGVFSVSLPNYTVTSTGSGYDWTLLLDFSGPNPTNNRSKSFKFNVTADLYNNMSINTKIGTDGYRTVTPTSETWVDKNQITNLFYGSNTNMYGSNYKLFGTSVDKYGINKVYGSATIDGTTPMSNPSYINIGSVAPLIKVSSSTTTDNDTNRLNGTIGWESFSYNPILPRIIVKHYGVHIIPKYILIEGRHPSYSSNWHLIMLNDGTSESDYLPIGTEVYIINQCGGDNIYATGYNASGTANLPKCIYGDNTTEAYKGIQIKNGWVASFVHLGGGYWKYLQHYVNDGSDGTNF